MTNRIKDILAQLKREQGITVTDFAEMSGVPASTLYGARTKKSMENISIDVFLKIAHALNMTAEELYYGTKPAVTYPDPRQTELNRCWESLDTERQNRLIDDAHDMEIAKSSWSAAIRDEEKVG